MSLRADPANTVLRLVVQEKFQEQTLYSPGSLSNMAQKCSSSMANCCVECVAACLVCVSFSRRTVEL